MRISVRAVATRTGAEACARTVTPVASPDVIADCARASGWLRVVKLTGSQAGSSQLYGIAIARVGHNRWADVRAVASFAGCMEDEMRAGLAARGLSRVLRTAAIRARVVRA